MTFLMILFVVLVVPCLCQRPFYAGLHPIGYPEVETTAKPPTIDGVLPAQLNGDKEYAKQLEKLPVDQRPFWYINKDQYEELMKHLNTYPQRPSVFNEQAAGK